MLYLLLKVVHVIAVIILMGNIITGVFWKVHADRTSDPRIMAHALEGLIRSDRLFTIPGVVVITAAGLATAIVGRIPILGTGWILWALALFSISGLTFILGVAPLQARLAALARSGADTGQWDRPAYHRLSRQWESWGLVVTLSPALAVLLMILKPVLASL
jgi:uncharacterized membrane protein